MKEDQYKEIKQSATAIFKDRGSKFIGISYKVFLREDIEEKISQVKQEYHNARHHCSAYRINTNKFEEKANDDGEPSGSAGRPILGQIHSHELTNVLVVVVRYFGGTKLGVSGLINAYKTAANEALNRSAYIRKTIDEYYRLKYKYPLMGEVMHLIKKQNVIQLETKFEIDCEIIIKVRKSEVEQTMKAFYNLYGLNIDYIKTE